MAHSVLLNVETSPQSSHLRGSISIPTWAASCPRAAAPLPVPPPALLQWDIYLSPPAFCLPSFPQLIYGRCLSAPGHRSLNLAIMCGSSRGPSICGAGVRPDGLPSSSSIFPAMLAHPFGSGQLHMCCWWPLGSHLILTEAFCPGMLAVIRWACSPKQGWDGFREVIREHRTGKNNKKIAFHSK